jgi:hypothetical protein
MDNNEQLDTAESDIQDLVSRWAGESKRLLVALPEVLAKLDGLQAETDSLRQRINDLDRENRALRQSREELAETFSKLKSLISGASIGADASGFEAFPPRPSEARASGPEPAGRGSGTDSQPPGGAAASQEGAPSSAEAASVEPAPRPAKEDKPAPAKPQAPTPPAPAVRFTSVFRPPTKS